MERLHSFRFDRYVLIIYISHLIFKFHTRLNFVQKHIIKIFDDDGFSESPFYKYTFSMAIMTSYDD